MTQQTYKALEVTETDDGSFRRDVTEKSVSDLPDHDVLVQVHYSSLNYKDALSATGDRGVTNNYPHTPGVDAAGVIEESLDDRFDEGDPVIVTSYDLGQDTPGGFGEYIRVPGDWIVPLPEGLSLRESMILGSAGFTAAYGMYKLRDNDVQPGDGEILVTGATGGVGSLSVTLLAEAGYGVVAATGKMDQKDFLKELGARRVIHRDEVKDQSGQPLLHSKWAGAIDTVGGIMLDTAIRETGHNGVVACCGNILGHELHTDVYPFILRGVSLMGIDSGICKMPMRRKIWQLLSKDWKPGNLEAITRECRLEDLEEEIKKILRGRQTGRIIVNLTF